MLKIENVSQSFGAKKVLNDISFEVEKGQILAIMGSSGGGKTTLLKCISGLLQVQSGEIYVDDINVNDNPEAARTKIGMVFQYAALFDFLNVSENILFGVQRKKRLSSKSAAELVQEQLHAVGLEGVAKNMPSELSGGMKKRVGLARALAMEPSILLYDEPTSGLDPVTAYSIDRLIVDTRDRTKCTSIVVSHDVTSVFRVADRIAFLEKGKLIFQGSVDEFRKAQNQEIRDLVSIARSEKFTVGTAEQ